MPDLALWALAGAAALLVAWRTKVGPVVLHLSARHGVHAGDVLFVAAAVVGCTAISAVRARR